ncbi:hypothetical protein KIN20_015736 [Parelaphostrongylus tenuis]|uniref:Uncharacterized protein n=1 Tax=Parelaphostrongylus tenuis TaxID=148309 RepID=A0AAD5MYW4_PARTN|nr:hypothetical protein KIN20_015736 [Parelaphostrongylus tenuis]
MKRAIPPRRGPLMKRATVYFIDCFWNLAIKVHIVCENVQSPFDVGTSEPCARLDGAARFISGPRLGGVARFISGPRPTRKVDFYILPTSRNPSTEKNGHNAIS